MKNRDYEYRDYLARSSDRYALAKYKIMMNWIPIKKDLKILNAGCGSGEMNLLLAKNKSWEIDAIDVNEDSLSLAQKLKEDNQLSNLCIFCTSIEEMVPKNKYDIIVSTDVLEHIQDDVAALKKLSGMLQPDGILCLSVPALQWLFGYHDEMLGHYRRYDKATLTERLSLFFEVKRCRYFGGNLIPIALLYGRFLRRPYPIGKQDEKSLITLILNALLKLETDIPLPFGTSLLAKAIVRK